MQVRQEQNIGSGNKRWWEIGTSAFNLLGSIASVTGVSLLWVKDRTTVCIDEIAAVAVAVTFSLGAFTAATMLLWRGYLRLAQGRDALWQWSYFLLGIPAILLLTTTFLLLTNKIMINFPFDWFFE